uniref:hypothetical protein n=1 Tax=Aminobacter niigataensis TaxID=83265 RepID=UPI0028529ADB|nr:hypothetical protein [Aminobacter niigataensis]
MLTPVQGRASNNDGVQGAVRRRSARRQDIVVGQGTDCHGQLLKSGELTDAQDKAIVARARQRVDESIDFAKTSDYPAPAEALEGVFA